MPEIEKNMFCENCGSAARLIYDTDEVQYEPENCPFCGEVVGSDDLVDEDELELNDDGLSDNEDDVSWN